MATCRGVKPVATSLPPQVAFVHYTIYIYTYKLYTQLHIYTYIKCTHIHLSRGSFDARAFTTTEILKCSGTRHMTISLSACPFAWTCSGYDPPLLKHAFVFLFLLCSSSFYSIRCKPPGVFRRGVPELKCTLCTSCPGKIQMSGHEREPEPSKSNISFSSGFNFFLKMSFYLTRNIYDAKTGPSIHFT